MMSRRKERFYIKNGFNSPFVAYLLNTDESSCWDNFKAFILKYFSWTWIKVKDTDQLINITGIVKNVGLTHALDWIKTVAYVFVPQHITAKAMQELMDLAK